MAVYRAEQAAGVWLLRSGELVTLGDGTRLILYRARLHHLSGEQWCVSANAGEWFTTPEEAVAGPLADAERRHAAAVADISRLLPPPASSPPGG